MQHYEYIEIARKFINARLRKGEIVEQDWAVGELKRLCPEIENGLARYAVDEVFEDFDRGAPEDASPAERARALQEHADELMRYLAMREAKEAQAGAVPQP